MKDNCYRTRDGFEKQPANRKPSFFLCMLIFLGMIASGHESGIAGQHCGAEGDWRNILIPDKWPPPETKKRFASVLGNIKTVPVYNACIRHDDCYGSPGAARDSCDKKFLEDMITECDRVYNGILEIHLQQACHLAAQGYYKAVEKHGMNAFQKAQSKPGLTVASAPGHSTHKKADKTAVPALPMTDARKENRGGSTADGTEKPAIAAVTGPLFFNSDFEAGDLTNWTAAGEAFQYQPTKGDNPTARKRNQSSRHQGDFWIGSFENYGGRPDEKPGAIQGDNPTGSLRSISFRIAGKRIGFLIGGGKKINELSVALVVENREVKKASGKNSETMERIIWNVEEFQGKTAQIVIKDTSSKGWGHINVDDFRFM